MFVQWIGDEEEGHTVYPSRIDGKEVVFQIDSGSTTNLLPAKYARDIIKDRDLGSVNTLIAVLSLCSVHMEEGDDPFI